MSKLFTSALLAIVVFAAQSRTAAAQTPAPWQTQQPPDTMNLEGPRFGITFLSDGVRNTLGERGADLGFAISQFGWQKEKRFLSSPAGWTGVTEWVLLFGGIDQGTVIPSLNWLVGWRSANGIEFAAGPNLTPAGAGLAIAGGVTFRTGNLNIPVNLAVVPSKSGARISMLAGFNMRRR